MRNDAEHLFIFLFAICIFSLVEGLSVSLAHFIIGSLFNVSFKKYFIIILHLALNKYVLYNTKCQALF